MAPQSLTTNAEISCLGAVTDFVRTGAREANLPATRVGELDLIVEEAVANICRHAYPGGPGIMTVTYSIPSAGELRVEIADQGVEFNPLSTPPPDLTLNIDQRPIGGLGVFLVKTLAKSLNYRREAGWNRLTFAVSGGS